MTNRWKLQKFVEKYICMCYNVRKNVVLSTYVFIYNLL